jgi:phosphotransferase system  glucose/maltose/N-acetylglucosamine-specific IIC component
MIMGIDANVPRLSYDFPNYEIAIVTILFLYMVGCIALDDPGRFITIPVFIITVSILVFCVFKFVILADNITPQPEKESKKIEYRFSPHVKDGIEL